MRHEFHEFTPMDSVVCASLTKFVTIRVIRVEPLQLDSMWFVTIRVRSAPKIREQLV